MADEIVNKVASSGLISLDLQEFVVPGERMVLDLSPFLFQGLILKEKEFRNEISLHDWEQYRDKYIAITCTADAIVPTWAFMLIAQKLTGLAKHFVFGSLETLETLLFSASLKKLNLSEFKDARVVVKGCSEEVPLAAYVELTRLLQPHVKSLMFGEPCSTVPVFKRKNG